jgi:oxygen-independent coproporphyrinogen-3 oxidase
MAVTSRRIPWSGQESLTSRERVEETVMLGMRLREGLDIRSVERMAGRPVPSGLIQELHDEGLTLMEDERLVPTRRGRLLNDAVIGRILDSLEP